MIHQGDLGVDLKKRGEQLKESLQLLIKFAQQVEQCLRQFMFGDLKTVMDMEDLKVLYFTVGDKARIFVIACKDVAAYACDSEIKEGDATGFSSFLSTVNERFNICASYHDKYSNAVKVFQDKAMQMAKTLQEEKKELQNAIDKTRLGTRVGVISVASSVMLISAIVLPLAGIATAAACVVTGGLSLAGVSEWSLSDRKKQVKGTKSNEELLTQCYTALTQVRTNIVTLQNNVEYSSEGLSDWMAKSDVTKDICKILKPFRELMIETRRLAEEYLKTISGASGSPSE